MNPSLNFTQQGIVNEYEASATPLLLEAKLMSLMHVVIAEYWGVHILHEPWGPNIGGSSPWAL